jgi:hypothetical protein
LLNDSADDVPRLRPNRAPRRMLVLLAATVAASLALLFFWPRHAG